MTLHERADKLLALREDLYEMHFHKVDREWLIETMIDFAQQVSVKKQVIEILNNIDYYYDLKGDADWLMNEIINRLDNIKDTTQLPQQETFKGGEFETFKNHISDISKMVEDDVDTPMVKRLKNHLNSITTEQFDKEIDGINKDLGYVEQEIRSRIINEVWDKDEPKTNFILSRLLDLYIEKTGYGMDMWSKEENAFMTTIAEIINNKAKETLYTEEQVREAFYLKDNFDMTEEEIIQSLKQPK